MSGSALTLERLGGGAAYVLHDPSSSTTLLLSCGEAQEPLLLGANSHANDAKASANSSADDGSGYDSVESATSGSGGVTPLATRTVRRYAHDLRALLRRQGDAALTAVLVPDYRPEASFMLPFLLEKCGPFSTDNSSAVPVALPPVILTHGTRAIAPHHLTEYWTAMSTGTAHDKDKALLYTEADIYAALRKTHAIGLNATIAINEHVRVTAYHAGHVAGGCAFLIAFSSGTTVLYARDFNRRGGCVFLPAAIPRRLEPTALITRSAFAVTVSETTTAMVRELLRVIAESVSAGGKVVLPIYKLGFFHELVALVLAYWRQRQLACPIYVTDASGMTFPSRFAPLVARTFTPAMRQTLADRAANTAAYPQLQAFDWKRLHAPGPFVLFTAPASIGQGETMKAVKAIASDAKNVVVLSEDVTPGTLNYALYADPQRIDASKRLGVTIACGVHYFPTSDEVDAKSIVEFVADVAPQQLVLDTIVPDDLAFVRAHVLRRMHAGSNSSSDAAAKLHVVPVAADRQTRIAATQLLPLKIHKSLFNSPFDVQGLLLAESAAASGATKRNVSNNKLLLVPTSNGARRLKKKRHALQFALTWQKEPEPPTAPRNKKKKKSARAPSAALAFLLSAPAGSTDDDDDDDGKEECETSAPPLAVADELLAALRTTLVKWLQFDDECDTSLQVEVASDSRWLKIRSVNVAVTTAWDVHLEWAFEDNALAARVLGIAKQVVHAEYKKLVG